MNEYERLIKEFGAKEIDSSSSLDFKHFKNGILYAHRDFDLFLKDLKEGKKVAIASGANPSGPLHLGHVPVFETNLYFQKKYGLHVFIPISDDESYVARKIKTQEEGLKNSIELARDILAFGFDPKKTHFIIDQLNPEIYNFAFKLCRTITLSMVKATYGYTDETNVGLAFYPSVQAAHVLLPLLKEYGGHERTLVPIGIDEDPHLRLARDVAAKNRLTKPSVLLAKFMPGLDGEKMSASKPETAILLRDNPEVARKKIMKAFTGGRETVEEQRKKGGNPDVCVVYKYLKVLFDTDVREKCVKGEIICGECKNMLADKVEKFLNDFQNKLSKITEEDVKACLITKNLSLS